ncbi:MAG: hypothetical protein ACLVAV_08130 [Clostridium sp.]
MKGILKDAFILFVITLVAGALSGRSPRGNLRADRKGSAGGSYQNLQRGIS